MGLYGPVGHARRFAGRVLQLVEEVAGLLDTYSVISLKLTMANETVAAHKTGGTLRALRRELVEGLLHR